MGMAASQARFLGLTARKNNVEFEGQQVNQQRTTLSNQTANYYNDLLGMAVPVPPSVDDYTKTVYTFQDGALTNQVTAMIAQPNGKYVVSYLRQWTDDFSVVGASTSIINKSGTDTEPVFKVGTTTLRGLNVAPVSWTALTQDEENQLSYAYINPDTKEVVALTKNADGKYEDNNGQEYPEENVTMYLIPADADDADDVTLVKKDGASFYKEDGYDDPYLSTLSKDQVEKLMKEEEEYIELLRNKYGEGDYVVRYILDTTSGEYNPYFYKLSDLTGAIYDDTTGNSQSNINCYKIGSETKSEEVKALPGCEIEKDSSGRYINITIPAYNADGTIDDTGNKITYALSTSTITDQAAYEDAMNQYEYEKYQYDQAIQEINSKIEIIQAEDKNLELRLKQLDTEQRAITTEIDAVAQVIQKNTESSFKTFG